MNPPFGQFGPFRQLFQHGFRGVGGKLKSDEKAFVVTTDGAGFGCGSSFMNMPAVQTHPLAFHVGYKKLVFLQKIGIGGKTVAVSLFDFRDVEKGCRDLWEAFFLCHSTESFVSVGVFFVFVAVGRAEKGEEGIADVNGITAVNSDVLSRETA